MSEQITVLWIPQGSWQESNPYQGRRITPLLAPKFSVHVADWTSLGTLPRQLPLRVRDGLITVHRLPWRIPGSLRFSFVRRLNMWLFSLLIQRIIDAYHVDVIISTPCINPPLRCRRILNMDDDHAAYWREFRRLRAFAEETEQRTKRWAEDADRIVTVGSVLAERISTLSPRTGGRVLVIPNAVDLRLFRDRNRMEARAQLRLPQETPIITLVSVLGEFSGVDLFVRAADILREKDITFIVIGEGTRRIPATALAQQLHLRNIRFLGHIPYAEVPRYLTASSVGVVAKPKSAFTDAACSIKAIEYSAAGLPVVATDLREIRAMHLPNVHLVPDTAEGIAGGILLVLSWGRVPAAELAPYDIETVGNCFKRIVRDVVHGAGRSS